MNSTLTIARRELTERRFVFVAAAAFLLLALVVPFVPAVRAGERVAALVVGSLALAMNFTLGLSAILGSTIIGKELSEGRLSFYFAKPVPATSIWWGKLLAAVLLIVLCFTIVAVPAFLVGTRTVRDWLATPAEMFTTASIILAVAFGLFLVAHVLGTFVRSRSVWFLFDFVAASVCGAAGWMLTRNLLLGGAIHLAREVGWVFATLAGIAIVAAGAWQVARGRTDRRRSHIELSRFMWTAIGCVMLLAIAYVMWVVSVPLSRIVNPEYVQASSGSWSVIGGGAKNRGDYHATFFYNLADQRAVRVPAVEPWRVRFSADGKTAAWMTPSGLYVARLDAASVEPVLTRITGDFVRSVSGDGSRAVVRSGDVVTTYDLRTEASLGSTRQSGNYTQPPAGFFLPDGRSVAVENRGAAAVLRVMTRNGALIREIPLPERVGRWPFITVSSTGVVAIPLRQHTVVVDPDKGTVKQEDRMLCPVGSVGPYALCGTRTGLVVWNPSTGEKRRFN